MFNYFIEEFYPAAGMPVSAIDGYVGKVVAAKQDPICIFTVFIESTQNFIDLNLFFVDRISQEHILLNINKQSLNHLDKL